MLRLDHTDKPTGPFEGMTPPLEGYWWETSRQVCIPWVMSRTPRAFLTFLRAQEAKGKAVVFPTVINARLDKLLRLRGYQECVVYVDYVGEDAECLVLRPELLAQAVSR